MSEMRGRAFISIVSVLALVTAIGTTGVVAQDEEMSRADQKITIGWTPPDITGVFKTATDFFELSAADANANGFDV